MTLDSLLESALDLYRQFPLPVALGAIALLFMAIKCLKASLKWGLLLLVLAAFFYAISLFSGVLSTGTRNADQMINKSRNLTD